MKLSLVLLVLLAVVAATYATSKVVCSKPAVPQYGYIRSGRRSLYKVGSKIIFACKRGYKLSGSTHLRCLKTGHWNPKPPVCTIICPRLAAPANGYIKFRNKGKKAIYRCNSGFILKGQSKRICTLRGWTGSQPSCVPKPPRCPRLPLLKNGFIKLRNNGLKAVHSCRNGFKLRGNSVRFCKSNRWTGSHPTCVPKPPPPPKCPQLEAPRYGSVSITNGGLKAIYKCFKGFVLKGSSVRHCTRNGWTGSAPICQKLIQECDELDDPENGVVDFKRVTIGSTAVYRCNRGFNLVGNAKRVCQRNGEWSGQEPKCRAIRCENLQAPRYGSVKQSGSTVGAQGVYDCNKGFTLKGNKIRKCLFNGQWSGSQPVCKRIFVPPPPPPPLCKKPVPPKFGSVHVTGSGIGAVAHYSCYRGYRLIGHQSIICKAGGVWAHYPPYCFPIYKG